MTLPELATAIRDSSPTDKGYTQQMLRVGVDLAVLRCNLRKELANAKMKYLYPQEKGKTELDRKVMLDAFVSDIERDYEFATRLETLLDYRLELT